MSRGGSTQRIVLLLAVAALLAPAAVSGCVLFTSLAHDSCCTPEPQRDMGEDCCVSPAVENTAPATFPAAQAALLDLSLDEFGFSDLPATHHAAQRPAPRAAPTPLYLSHSALLN